jgi:hypothetical protein
MVSGTGPLPARAIDRAGWYTHASLVAHLLSLCDSSLSSRGLEWRFRGLPAGGEPKLCTFTRLARINRSQRGIKRSQALFQLWDDAPLPGKHAPLLRHHARSFATPVSHEQSFRALTFKPCLFDRRVDRFLTLRIGKLHLLSIDT